LYQSNKDEIIVCWLDVVGLYVFIFSKILFTKRKIVVINIMFNQADNYITKIKYILFKWMLNNKNTFPTVTSRVLQKHYKNIFKSEHKSYDLVHDCYGSLERFKRSYKKGDGYVFCGGTNGRDWNLLVKVAKSLPSINFVIVGPQKDTLSKGYPENIKYYYNITFQKFQDLMSNSSLCILPLNTQAPAGLIVLYTAGLMSKPVITSNNITMSEYIDDGVNGILIDINDTISFAKAINLVISDEIYLKKIAQNLNEKVIELGSPKNYIKNILKIINKINNENSTN
jgi:glycosyltransferase involved in cell wall biosynthesis